MSITGQETSAAAKCDVCDRRPGVRSITAYGIETWACAECLGEEIEDEPMDDATRYALGAM